jgi:AcrR family transcriptional regulator
VTDAFAPDQAPPSAARQRLLDNAYELFSRRGIRAVGVEEVISRAAVAKATLYRHFPSKDDLVLAFLEERELRWTRQFVEAGARERGASAEERLLAIFDVFHDWFQQEDYKGCSLRPAIANTRSATSAPDTSRTCGRSCAHWPKRPASATPRRSPSPGICL